MGPVASSPVAEPAVCRRLGDLLAPPPPVRRPLRAPADVGGRAAWDVLVRDGVLEVVRGDAAVATGTPLTAADRAGTLTGVPTGAVVAGRTAAWVHAGRRVGDEGRLDLTYPAGSYRPTVWGAGLVWQAPLLRDDVVERAGVRVTAPARTVVDLALHLAPDDATPRVVALVRWCGVDLEEASRLLERRVRAVGRPRARTVLDRARAALAGALGAAAGALP
ncbi:hypothetical protein GCM10009809_34930 [Isoptericola hypogeus]|uniref:Transcriptional regulator with AbiEi antitoxin domain of type IV toxin-antitoxin system n=1 Tax=Isoptericola hypogeus TaxID=300179 RepID=A0ABN2JRQ3_9MICO